MTSPYAPLTEPLLPLPPKPGRGIAVAALSLAAAGILFMAIPGIGLLLGLVGLVLGIVGIPRSRGRSLAVGGVVVAATAMLGNILWTLVIVWLIGSPMFWQGISSGMPSSFGSSSSNGPASRVDTPCYSFELSGSWTKGPTNPTSPVGCETDISGYTASGDYVSFQISPITQDLRNNATLSGTLDEVARKLEASGFARLGLVGDGDRLAAGSSGAGPKLGNRMTHVSVFDTHFSGETAAIITVQSPNLYLLATGEVEFFTITGWVSADQTQTAIESAVSSWKWK